MFSCPLRQTRSGFFQQAFYPQLLYLSFTHDRRLAPEIPLSNLVAVDRLTSFGSVLRRCSKALQLRKQPMQGIESSVSRRAPPFRLLSTGPCLHCIIVRCLASSQRSVTSPRKGTTSFPSTKTEQRYRCRPRLAPQFFFRPTMLAQSEKFLDQGTVTRPPSNIYARVNCSVIRDRCTRVQGHPRNLFQRPWIFGLSSLKHHT